MLGSYLGCPVPVISCAKLRKIASHTSGSPALTQCLALGCLPVGVFPTLVFAAFLQMLLTLLPFFTFVVYVCSRFVFRSRIERTGRDFLITRSLPREGTLCTRGSCVSTKMGVITFLAFLLW